MIQLRYAGGIGNRLFQYVYARIIAEELGYFLWAPRIPGFPGTQERVRGQGFKEPIEVVKKFNKDLADIISNRSPRMIVSKGGMSLNYQRDLALYAEFIKAWLDPKHRMHQIRDEFIPDSRDLVVHLRLGDFKQLGFTLGSWYYDHILSHAKFDRLILVTEPGYTNEDLRLFKQYDPVIHAGHWYRDFMILVRAKCLATAASTFSWWAAYLGDQELVYAPLPRSGYFAAPHVDLRVSEARYCHIIEPKRRG
ncbi:MAG: O-fucosyltransferase family protein [Planctomycetota bacterium]|jgi:hypothetical protein